MTTRRNQRNLNVTDPELWAKAESFARQRHERLYSIVALALRELLPWELPPPSRWTARSRELQEVAHQKNITIKDQELWAKAEAFGRLIRLPLYQVVQDALWIYLELHWDDPIPEPNEPSEGW